MNDQPSRFQECLDRVNALNDRLATAVHELAKAHHEEFGECSDDDVGRSAMYCIPSGPKAGNWMRGCLARIDVGQEDVMAVFEMDHVPGYLKPHDRKVRTSVLSGNVVLFDGDDPPEDFFETGDGLWHQREREHAVA